MASGRLGAKAIPANVWTEVYKVPAGKTATVNIRVVNRDGVQSGNLKLAMCMNYVPGAAATDDDWIEPPNVTMAATSTLEDSAFVMSPGESVVAWGPAALFTVRVHGYESVYVA